MFKANGETHQRSLSAPGHCGAGNLRIARQNGVVADVPVRCRIDTPIEIDYYQHGGILPYVLRQIVARN